MNADDPVLVALRSLAESDRDKEAPPDVEARMKRAFRQKYREFAPKRGERRRVGWWAGAAAAVIAIGFAAAILVSTSVHTALVHKTAHRAGSPPGPATVKALANPPDILQGLPGPQAGPAVIPAGRKSARVRRQGPHEIVTEFFPLIDVAPPFERGELVRVNVPAAAMRTVGLPVDEDHLGDRVQADVLVGEEGLPRAIRFVKSLN